ncbi:MAG: hypothetical protein CL600_04195 [Alteromonas sp.]|nr:hypothetical protein [Alteromonas sp.]
MQLSLFATQSAKKKRKVPSYFQFDWNRKLNFLSQTAVQSDLVNAVLPDSIVETYKSGSSGKTDLLGYMAAGANIGVCAIDASKPVLLLIAQYVSAGGQAFIDSGAFRNFKARIKDETFPHLDFDKVFQCYDTVIEASEDIRTLILVAPDEVGNQEQSFQLLCRYQKDVKALQDRGAQIMVPLQKGRLSLTEHYYRCRKLLGFDFICGLPSNAKAVSSHEINQFLINVSPTSVHFLGTAESGLVHEAKFKSPDTHFTCDATLIRKHIGQNRLLTEMQSQIVDDALCCALHGNGHSRVSDSASWDETEVLGDLIGFIDAMNKNTVRRFALALSTSYREVISCEDNDELWSHLDERNHGYAHHYVMSFVAKECARHISPQVRKSVVHELASLNII